MQSISKSGKPALNLHIFTGQHLFISPKYTYKLPMPPSSGRNNTGLLSV